MNITDCYQLLGLSPEASFAEIKAAYRRLAQQYHPDTNPGDQEAKEKFIALTKAYKLLANEQQDVVDETPPESVERSDYDVTPQKTWRTKVTRKEKPSQNIPQLSEAERQLKWRSYNQLQQLLKNQRFPKAIALVEDLARSLPQDPEVRSWQALAYQRWGRQLVNEQQLDKARDYLKKALKTDPHNRSLWSEVERDFRRIEQIF